MPVPLGRDPHDPLSQHIRAADRRYRDAQKHRLQAHLLDAARLVRDPFPDATELLVEIQSEDLLTATVKQISSPREILWIWEWPGLSPVGYRTSDGTTLDGLLHHVELILQIALDDAQPDDFWQETARRPGTYQVPLPRWEDIDRAVTPAPAGVSRAELAELHTWLTAAHRDLAETHRLLDRIAGQTGTTRAANQDDDTIDTLIWFACNVAMSLTTVWPRSHEASERQGSLQGVTFAISALMHEHPVSHDIVRDSVHTVTQELLAARAQGAGWMSLRPRAIARVREEMAPR